MKKIATMILAALLLCGCGTQTPVETTVSAATAVPADTAPIPVEGTAAEVIDKIYAAHKAIDLPLMTMTVDLADANTLSYNTALTDTASLTDVAVSEPLMGQAYSLVVVRAKDAKAAEAAARTMLDGVDTRKWICVEADTKAACYAGDLAVFFMVSSEFSDLVTVDSMMQAVESVCGSLTVLK